MARIRTIKPEFWLDEDLASCSEPARLLAIGLLNLADDEGFFNANPKLLQSQIFPLTEPSVNIHTLITELSNIGYIITQKGTDNKTYGLIRTFLKHQNINRPNKSKISILVKFTEHSLSNHGALIAGTGKGTGKGKDIYSENEKKENDILNILQPVDENLLNDTQKENRLKQIFEELINAEKWQTDVALYLQKSQTEVKVLIPEFIKIIRADGEYFKPINNIKFHFRNWAKRNFPKQDLSNPAITIYKAL